MPDESLAAFMDVTGCSYDEAFHRLASCGGHLGKAMNRFFNVDAGTSGTRRSPPPPQVTSSDSETEDDEDGAARAPVPARGGGGGARGRTSPPGSAPRKVSARDSEAKGGGGRGSKSSRRRGRREMEASRNKDCGKKKKKRRRVGEDDGPYRGGKVAGGDRKSSGRRRRRFRDNFASSSDSEEEEEVVVETKKSRRRLNPKDDDTSDGADVQVISSSGGGGGKAPTSGAAAVVKKEGGNSSSLRRRIPKNNNSDDDDMEVYEAPPPPPPPRASKSDQDKLFRVPPPPPPRASKSDKDKLFRVPHGLTYKGGFHDAVAHAARRCRWLLVNVQGLDLASLAQNRDVWGSDLVAECVREHFVLWQADAGDEEEKIVAGGEGEEATKVLGYYKIPRDKVPVVVVVDPVTGQAMGRLHGTDPNDFLVSLGPYTDKRPAFPVAGAAKNNKRPAATTAPTSRQEQAPTVRKPPAEQQPASVETKVCKLRVRLPDGRVVAKDFGSECAVAKLFAYCRSEMGAGAAAARPFRLLRFVGAARVEIGNYSASFESLGLHMSTVCVDLG